MATLVSSFHFVSSYLWAPPVASQFSVLSQTFVKVRAPPVATLLFHLISSHHFSWHRLWRHSFLLFGHRQWRPLSFHITASFLWAPPVATQFSCLSYSELYVRAPSGAILLCHLSSSPHLSGLRLWRLSFLFCHRLHTHTYIHTYIQCAYICWSICQAAGQNVGGASILCHSWKMELWRINTSVGGFEVVSIDAAL